jgi:hypothetical protein
LTSCTGRDQGADAECQRGKHDDLLASDAVRQRSEQERADHQSKQAGAEHRPKHGPAEAQILGERRRDITDGLGIETVQEQHRRAGQQQPDLKSTDRLGIDECREVDRRATALGW